MAGDYRHFMSTMNRRKTHRHTSRTLIRAVALAIAVTGAALFANDAADSPIRPSLQNFNYDVSWVVMPDSVMVGDVIAFHVTLAVPAGTRVTPPETGNGFGNFSVLSQSQEIISGHGYDTVLYNYSLALYRPQNCTIPELIFLAGADTLATEAIPVRVISVIPFDIPEDSVLSIKDLKAQQKTGGADIRWLWILLAVAAVAAACYLLKKYAKKKQNGETNIIPLKPPYEEAVEAIEKLEAKKLIENGRVREYAFELSEIFKRYMGRRYDTIASELTTEEIVSWLELSGINRELRMSAEWFFRTSDQVKFAKWEPDSQTTNRFMKEVRLFLEATKPGSELHYERQTDRMGVVE